MSSIVRGVGGFSWGCRLGGRDSELLLGAGGIGGVVGRFFYFIVFWG